MRPYAGLVFSPVQIGTQDLHRAGLEVPAVLLGSGGWPASSTT
nr:hypothetical protein GCM10025730_01590 [Promicromonospora thailandica]